MDLEFWNDRWENGQIGFHQDDHNAYLTRYWPKLALAKRSTVFVPMAGKSKDIIWILAQGFKVIAVELSEIAVKAFFEENQLEAEISQKGKLTVYSCKDLTFYCGDFFDLTPDLLASIGAMYDRAALIALPQDMRATYVEKVFELMPSLKKILLVTMEYAQAEMDGPPFAVMEREVTEHYHDAFKIKLLEMENVLEANLRFKEKGLHALYEKVFYLKHVD